jgi:hypothetical protein
MDTKKRNIYDFLSTILFVIIGIILNLGFYEITSRIGSLLYLDMIGTAMVSLAYGPFHGALCGILSAFIGGTWVFQTDYSAFALVHVVGATIWGVLPRLLRGRLCSDIFNPGYTYSQQFIGMLWIGAFSGLMCGIVAKLVSFGFALPQEAIPADLMGDNRHEALHAFTLEIVNKLIHCEGICDTPEWLFFAMYQAISIPDKIVIFATGVILISYLKPKHRVKMNGFFGHVIVTSMYGRFFVLAYILSIIPYFGIILDLLQEPIHREQVLFLILTAIIWLLPFLVIIFRVFEKDLKYFDSTEHRDREIYHRPQENLEKAFEDVVKLITVTYAIIYVYLLSSSAPAISEISAVIEDSSGVLHNILAMPQNPMINDTFGGAVGLLAVLTFHRYIALIIVRVFQR